MNLIHSTDVPACIATLVAFETHQRGCGTLDGGYLADAPAFDGRHRSLDTTRAATQVADLCNALGVGPADLWAIADVAASDVPI